MAGKLTSKQMFVLQRASEGVSFDRMAREAGVSFHSIKSRSRGAYRNTGTNNLVHAVAVAIVRGDIPGPLVCDSHE